MREVFHDPIRRRAALLSLTVHLVIFLIFLFFALRPTVTPPPVIVVDLGPPALSTEEVIASTGETDAPSTPLTEVEATEVGTATAQVAPQEEAVTDEAATASASPPDVSEPSPPERPAAAPAPVIGEPTSVPTEVAVQDPLPEPEVVTEQLPEITPPEPTAMQDLATVAIREPTVSASPIAERPLTAPTTEASTPEAREIGEPTAEATVLESRTLGSPSASVSDFGERELPTDHASVDQLTERPLPSSGAAAEVAESRPLLTTSASVTDFTTRAVPMPSVVAEVMASEPASGAPAANVEGTPGSSTVESTVVADTPPGGTSDQAGQVGESASDDGRGAASSPDGEAGATGGSEPTITTSPFSQTRQRPYAVLIDNLNGYPQRGLREATTIIEAPVEGFITRLMAFYDVDNPVVVGPVRSARDYFLDLARASRAVLVHDGGSPNALNRIEAESFTTFNAYREGQLFYRDAERAAPYNLYTRGDDVRLLVQRRLQPAQRVISTARFQPEGFTEVQAVHIPFTAQYTTGFRYEAGIGRYRWIRNGVAASDANDFPLLFDAVLVAEAPARAIPADPAGRLFVALDKGNAVLYINGQALPGTWELTDEGATPPIRFRTESGTALDLTPMKTWIVLAPTEAFRGLQEVTEE